jgi:hypothetical protein
MKFPAKYSWIRSYGTFWSLQAEKMREDDVPGRFEGRIHRIIVHEVGK